MKRLMLTSVAIATLLAVGSAMAADMSVPYKAAPMAVAPIYNWTGCYIGIHGGGAAMRDNQAGTWSDGGLVGGQLGCNYQIDHLVVGVEGEGAWSGVDSTQNFRNVGVGNTLTTNTFKDEWYADIATRFGLAYDRFFFYEKIGVMWGDHKFSNSSSIPNVGTTTTSGSATLPGLFWGLGLEYGLTAQWTAKVETDFVYYAAKDATLSCISTALGCGGANTGTGITSVNSIGVIAKVGLNYRF